MNCCNKWCKFSKLLIGGLVILIVAMVSQSVIDVIIAIGILMIIKAVCVAIMPDKNSCEDKPKKRR